jgi:hypothetical protein
MNGYIKESNRGGVYNRLYLDSTVRKKKQEIINKQSVFITDSNSKPRATTENLLVQKQARPSLGLDKNKIENLLMQKYAKTVAKIDNMRTKQQIKEAQELKSGPQINKISKEIAEFREGSASDHISLYTARLLNSSRSASGLKIVPKQSFLSLIDLENGGNCFKNVDPQPQEKNQFFIEEKIKANRELAASRIKASRQNEQNINELRQAAFSKYKTLEPEEPVDILKMSVLERSNHWIKNKEIKLKQKEENKTAQETSGCTFSPRLTPRLNLNSVSTRHPSTNNSYSSRYASKPAVRPSSTKKADERTFYLPENRPITMQSLSPYQRTLSLGQTQLLQNLKPMISYKT